MIVHYFQFCPKPSGIEGLSDLPLKHVLLRQGRRPNLVHGLQIWSRCDPVHMTCKFPFCILLTTFCSSPHQNKTCAFHELAEVVSRTQRTPSPKNVPFYFVSMNSVSVSTRKESQWSSFSCDAESSRFCTVHENQGCSFATSWRPTTYYYIWAVKRGW